MAIMIPTLIKNITSRPKTRLYPAEERTLFPGSRGHIEFDSEKCIFCSLCEKRCPAKAIVVDRKTKTLVFYPFRCIVCEACTEACTKSAITLKEKWRSPATTKGIEILQETKTADGEQDVFSYDY
jgi:Formate hydrogenlyase subunit 6/NADH:ubiquinone oxidoreductase 23 kD subunit (chain I)